jgi:hypothetical protein
VNLSLLNPIWDSSWDDLIARHPQASLFHQRGWLQALVRTYGYEPFVLTSAAPGELLKDGFLLCRVSSWMTGTRLVSLPFSDHCEPLLNESNEVPVFANWLCEQCRETVELRRDSTAWSKSRDRDSLLFATVWFLLVSRTGPKPELGTTFWPDAL